MGDLLPRPCLVRLLNWSPNPRSAGPSTIYENTAAAELSMEQQLTSATKVQRWWRCRQFRAVRSEKRRTLLVDVRSNAVACNVQSRWRGLRARGRATAAFQAEQARVAAGVAAGFLQRIAGCAGAFASYARAARATLYRSARSAGPSNDICPVSLLRKRSVAPPPSSPCRW